MTSKDNDPFPSVSRYLASLPEGVASYPGSDCKGSAWLTKMVSGNVSVFAPTTASVLDDREVAHGGRVLERLLERLDRLVAPLAGGRALGLRLGQRACHRSILVVTSTWALGGPIGNIPRGFAVRGRAASISRAAAACR